MSCLLSTGRLLDCKTQIGGIKEVLFGDWGVIGNSYVLDANEQLTDFDAATLYRYELKSNTNTFSQEITANGDNSSVFYTQTVTIALPDLTPAYRLELQKMIRNRRLVIFVRDMHDKIHTVGLDRGAEVTGGSVGVGGAAGDFRGATLTFTAETRLIAPLVEPYTTTPFDNIANATISPAY